LEIHLAIVLIRLVISQNYELYLCSEQTFPLNSKYLQEALGFPSFPNFPIPKSVDQLNLQETEILHEDNIISAVYLLFPQKLSQILELEEDIEFYWKISKIGERQS
jgi:hypothetical protein